jgi:hypothetical protein
MAALRAGARSTTSLDAVRVMSAPAKVRRNRTVSPAFARPTAGLAFAEKDAAEKHANAS